MFRDILENILSMVVHYLSNEAIVSHSGCKYHGSIGHERNNQIRLLCGKVSWSMPYSETPRRMLRHYPAE